MDRPSKHPEDRRANYSGQFADRRIGKPSGVTIAGDHDYGPDEYDSEGVLKPRHARDGAGDAVWEHEDDRLDPAREDRSASGAGTDKPKSPANTA